jgi:hypothetical protein
LDCERLNASAGDPSSIFLFSPNEEEAPDVSDGRPLEKPRTGFSLTKL